MPKNKTETVGEGEGQTLNDRMGTWFAPLSDVVQVRFLKTHWANPCTYARGELGTFTPEKAALLVRLHVAEIIEDEGVKAEAY